MTREPDGWSTHLEALAWAVFRSQGAIVELGGGNYSTPWLHSIPDRDIWTVEADVEWEGHLRRWEGPRHHVIHDARMEIPWEAARPGVVFIDHDQATPSRADSIRQARARKADYIVVHDTNPEVFPWAGQPGLPQALGEFAEQWTFKEFSQWTTVLAGV